MPSTTLNETLIVWGPLEGPRDQALEAVIIYVNEDQLAVVQYLLYQSSIGNHILFDNETIKRIAPTLEIGMPKPEERERIENAERLLEQLILCPTIDSKLHFLEKLDASTYDEVAKVYLKIVQNAASENHYRH